MQCHGDRAPPALLALGSLAIAFFGIGVPLLYAGLLFSCRDAIRREASTPLSNTLAFLHASFYPWALGWPLVEAARALLLTGFLALVAPGSIFQLLLGLLVAIVFLVLQLWWSPYRTPSNNFLAMGVSVSIVLNLVGSICVQEDAKYGSEAVNPILLSAPLCVATFAAFLLTLLFYFVGIRKAMKSRIDSTVSVSRCSWE